MVLQGGRGGAKRLPPIVDLPRKSQGEAEKERADGGAPYFFVLLCQVRTFVRCLLFVGGVYRKMVAVILQLVDVQNLSGQEVLNVLHYVDAAGAGTPQDLYDDYKAHVIPLLQSLQGPQLTHVALRHRQVYPTATIMLEDAITPPLAGSATGEQLASCDAISVKHILGNPTVTLSGGFTGHIKRGGIRIAGATEPSVSGNDCPPGTISGVTAIMDEMRNPGSGAYELAVVSFLIGNPIPHVPRARSHTVTSYTIVSADSAPSPSTQNSRKVLRGRIR